MRFKHFKLPPAILTQLDELTTGYHLVIRNDKGQFETYVCYPDESAELAFINYLDITATALQERIRMRAMGLDDCDE